MIDLVRVTFGLLTWLIVARALLTWMPNIRSNPAVRFVNEITEPIIRPIQKILPYNFVPFSPIIAILVIRGAQNLLVKLMFSLM